jgi:hypothetical protein
VDFMSCAFTAGSHLADDQGIVVGFGDLPDHSAEVGDFRGLSD